MKLADKILVATGFKQIDNFILSEIINEKFNLKCSLLFLFFMAFLFLLLLFNIGVQFINGLIGYFYPAYQSFKSITTLDQKQDQIWIAYWIIFGGLTSFDGLIYQTMKYLPFFYFFKALFLLWLYHPKTAGALLLFNFFLKPFLRKEEQVEEKNQEI